MAGKEHRFCMLPGLVPRGHGSFEKAQLFNRATVVKSPLQAWSEDCPPGQLLLDMPRLSKRIPRRQ